MSERNPSKQRRAAQNKAARQSLANRTTKARAVPGSPSEAKSAAATRGASRRITTPAKGRGGRPSRTATPAAVRQPKNPLSRFLTEVQSVPGGKGMFFAFLFSVVSAIVLLFTRAVPQEVLIFVMNRIANARKVLEVEVPPGFDPDQRIYEQEYAYALFGPIAIVLALVPVAITSIGLVLTRRPNQRRNFTILAFVMGVFVMFFSSLALYSIFVLLGLIYAAYKARQADPGQPRASRRTRGSDTGAHLDDGADTEVDD